MLEKPLDVGGNTSGMPLHIKISSATWGSASDKVALSTCKVSFF